MSISINALHKLTDVTWLCRFNGSYTVSFNSAGFPLRALYLVIDSFAFSSICWAIVFEGFFFWQTLAI
jgi:hypothetical protein